MEIKDKVVIVTGASSGIGMASAKLLSEKGAKVVLAARSKEKLEELSKELPESLVVATDMTEEKDIINLIEKATERFGRVDILINNAGQGMSAPVEKISVEKYRAILDLNVIGPLLAMEKVIPIMRGQGGGMIMNISSMVSKMYLPGIAAYASTKYALNALSLTARKELENDNIIVSVVHPYITETNFFRAALKVGEEDYADTASERSERSGMPPGDSPEKVAKHILKAIETEEAETMLREWK